MSDYDVECEQLIADCENRDDQLSSWEINFIDSLRNWIGKGEQLTLKQKTRLDEIWERVTT